VDGVTKLSNSRAGLENVPHQSHSAQQPAWGEDHHTDHGGCGAATAQAFLAGLAAPHGADEAQYMISLPPRGHKRRARDEEQRPPPRCSRSPDRSYGDPSREGQRVTGSSTAQRALHERPADMPADGACFTTGAWEVVEEEVWQDGN
jgi:hypothetical protein